MAPDAGVVVTGASTGIGAATARELSRRGLAVACLSRRGEPPADGGDGELVPYTCDVTDHDRVRAVVEDFAARAGGIRGLVNNAGFHAEARAVDAQPADLMRMFEVNCASALACAQAARPHLAKANGVIVGIGSFFDKLSLPGSLAYAASKAALASIDRTLAVEWARDGISSLTVAPGYILTDLNADWLADDEQRRKVERRIPAGRVGDASEVARLVSALVLGDMPFLTGETIYIDGGHSVRA
jgi:NAD(P)-dependent dehydrogenase (short-subunit alcohol dehydrogenase family)